MDPRKKRVLMRIGCWGVVAACIAFTVYVYFSDPFQEGGTVTLCAFHRLTGLDCPGCGMTRAAWLLMHGHPIESFKMNPFLWIIFVAAYMGVAEMSPHLFGKQLPQLSVPNWALITALVAVVAFCIVRNVLKFV